MLMRFVNVNDRTYEMLTKISEETGKTMLDVVDDLIGGFMHFGMLSAMQDLALDLAKQIICEDEENGEK